MNTNIFRVKLKGYGLENVIITPQSGGSQNGFDGGSNWANATLAFIATDIAIPEPTDAAWPKWAGYAVAGTAAAAYIAYNY